MTSSHLGSQAIGDDALWFHGLSRDAVLYRLKQKFTPSWMSRPGRSANVCYWRFSDITLPA